MASFQAHSLKSLFVFKNYMYPELIRAVHVHKLEDGVEKEVEREYLFRSDSDYEEIGTYKVLTLEQFRPSAHSKGVVNGVWVCIYVFDADRHKTSLDNLPDILSVNRNPKLASIPTLANDLKVIFQMNHGTKNGEEVKILPEETSCGNHAGGSHVRNQRVFPLDLNSVPYPESENEGGDKASG